MEMRASSRAKPWSPTPCLATSPACYYFHFSQGQRHKTISQAFARLARRSTADHQSLIEAAGAQALIRRTGLLIIFRSPSVFERDVIDAERVAAEYGVPMSIMDGCELATAEPDLKLRLSGAVHWTGSWSCADPGGLTEAYAKLFAARGGSIIVGDANTLLQQGSGWAVAGPSGAVNARDVVVALGPWSTSLLEKFGYDIPLFRKRGYHRHFTGGGTLNVPVLDAENGTCISPMRAGLRVLTGAEIARFDAPPTPRQMARSEGAAAELLNLGQPVEAEPWFGNRPCMPDMLPLVGAAPRHKGLWFHFGHGHQGFTQGPTTAALLAQEMTGGSPPMPELSPNRLMSWAG
jgi:D-amino-acid dehydrogenase